MKNYKYYETIVGRKTNPKTADFVPFKNYISRTIDDNSRYVLS